MTQEIAKKWEEIFSDKDYATALLKMSEDEALAELNSKGYNFTKDDMAEAAEAIKLVASHISEDGELSEELLAEISGGVLKHAGSFIGGVATVGAAALVGFTIGLACW